MRRARGGKRGKAGAGAKTRGSTARGREENEVGWRFPAVANHNFLFTRNPPLMLYLGVLETNYCLILL